MDIRWILAIFSVVFFAPCKGLDCYVCGNAVTSESCGSNPVNQSQLITCKEKEEYCIFMRLVINDDQSTVVRSCSSAAVTDCSSINSTLYEIKSSTCRTYSCTEDRCNASSAVSLKINLVGFVMVLFTALLCQF